MTKIDILRNELIDKLLTISDKDYLIELNKLVDSKASIQQHITFSKEQHLMLSMSESDIAKGALISQADLDKNDLKWLKEL